MQAFYLQHICFYAMRGAYAVSILYAPSYVCTCVAACMLLRACVLLRVGGFRTLGLHRVEGPAQEPLIERDLRDMAGVSMLRHAETGLWWAVKSSRRLRTANVCVCVCISVGALEFVPWNLRGLYFFFFFFLHVQIEELVCSSENEHRFLLWHWVWNPSVWKGNISNRWQGLGFRNKPQF